MGPYYLHDIICQIKTCTRCINPKSKLLGKQNICTKYKGEKCHFLSVYTNAIEIVWKIDMKNS